MTPTKAKANEARGLQRDRDMANARLVKRLAKRLANRNNNGATLETLVSEMTAAAKRRDAAMGTLVSRMTEAAKQRVAAQPVDADKVDALLKVLAQHEVNDELGQRRWTFARIGVDALDFSSISVWQLRSMLEDAYYAGKADGRTQMIAIERSMEARRG